jgi:hypothetical protein
MKNMRSVNRIQIQWLHKRLNEEGYFCDLDFVLKLAPCLWAGAGKIAGAFLAGPAGCGKTALLGLLERILGFQLFYRQCMPNERREQLMIKALPADDTKSGVRLVPQILLEAFETLQQTAVEVMVGLDEWDKTALGADSVLKEILESGRISVSGVTIQLTLEQMERLTVFICMNNERELDSSLLSLLPKFEFTQLSPDLIRQALAAAHPDNPYVESLVVLYKRCLLAKMSKPCTLQELEQLLQALTNVRNREGLDPLYDSDHKFLWDVLVLEYVTKTRANHELLRKVEGRLLLQEEGVPLRLSSLAAALWREVSIQEPTAPPPVFGIIRRTDGSYARLAKLIDAPRSDPGVLGEFVVSGETIVLTRPIALSEHEMLAQLWGLEGEILIVEPRARLNHVLELVDRGLLLSRFTRQEVVGFAPGVAVRWSPGAGAEIVVDLMQRKAFEGLDIIGLRDPCWQSTGPYNNSHFLKLLEPVVDRPARLQEGVTYFVPMGEGLPPAKIEVKRDLQQRTGEGDRLKAIAYVYLPTGPDSSNNRLHPDLQFGPRLQVCAERLHMDWGVVQPDGCYTRMKVEAVADTWTGAIERAGISAFQEVDGLVLSLQKRRMASA